MKRSIIINLLALNFAIVSPMIAQTINPHSIAVLNIDAQGFTIDPGQMSNLTRIELLKLDLYEVVDKHEIKYVMEKNNIDPNNCYNKACLIDVGKLLNAGKVLTGSVEVLSEKILINFRLLDVENGTITNTEVLEFLNLPDQVNTMIGLTLLKMFNKKVDDDLMNNLTNQYDYGSTVSEDNTENLKLNGPRMGITIFSGDLADAYAVERENGGYGAAPVMFQFGYQFEVRYLSTGDFQALFEFIPIITGLDQGLFIPSFSFLNGLRSNKTGIELAFGPILSMVRLEELPNGISIPSPNGSYSWKAGFVFGVGKTFRSGRLNFPVNAFFLPGKSGHRYGLSVGFNRRSY